MGLRAAKSLLPVRDGLTFVDLIVRQVGCLREASGARVRLLLMNSFATSADTRAWLAAHAAGDFADPAQFELMQNQVPKIDAATLRPAAWPAEPELEWCPPGHGDLYPALAGSGRLAELLDSGVRYAFVSNSDNLGAVLDPALLRRFAASGAPFLMEVTRRTAADRKGGHLARRRSDGRLLLREVAQCPAEDSAAFQDIARHRYFNTNNIWLRLDALHASLAGNGGVLPLPVIRNQKTIDPRDKGSTQVIQLETAMGAAIECFEGAGAIEVPRTRFAPVKTTADLLAVRSDAYQLGPDGRLELAPGRAGEPPVVELDPRYRLVDGLDRLGLPSLCECRRLVVEGEVRFAPGVVFAGEVIVRGDGSRGGELPAGVYRDCEVKV
jgi:UDP-N-acetylglucosamine pyrophosphorylase